MPVQHTAHARYELWYHFAWGTKYRKKIWTEAYTKQRVATLLKSIAASYDISIKDLQVMSDHVHLLASAPPRLAPSRIAQIIKSVSTTLLFEEFTWLKRHYWGGEVWVRGYFVRSVGVGLTTTQIERYIKEQTEEN
jgi:putative transposase